MQKKHLTKFNIHSLLKKKKTLNTVGLEGIYFNVIKCYVTSPTANIILSGEKL